jgi:protein involved in polysaccharide export with SLBB domain
MEAKLLLKIFHSPLRKGLSVILLLAAAGLSLAQTNTSLSPQAPVAEPADVNVNTAELINSMDALNDEHKLTIGDRVSYRVIEEEKDIPTSLVVTDSGELPIPIIGLFPAAGKTCKQLAEQLKPLLEKDYFYKATVIVGLDTESTRSLGKVYLTGQVKAQGTLDLPANQRLTVSQAIMENGGFADFANQRRVNLLRRKPDGTSEKMIIDVKDILMKGHSEKDPVLQPDDTIEVPEKLINF